MIRRLVLIGLLSVLLVNPVFGADILSVRYVKNYDGDTVTVAAPYLPEPFRTLRVRMAGIDTPEIKGQCAREKSLAKQAQLTTAGLLYNAKTIDLLDVKLGIYGRVVAVIRIDDHENVHDRLLGYGLAVRTDGKSSHDWCTTPTTKGEPS